MMGTKVLHLIGQMERGGAERQLLYLTRALKDCGWEQAVVTLNPGDAWDHELTSNGIPLFGVPRQRNKLLRLCRLAKIIAGERPAVIHSWSHHTSVYARWLPNLPKSHLVFSLRNIPTVDNYNGEQLKRVGNASIYSAADCVVSNSRAAIKAVRSAGVKMRRTELMNNIVVTRARARPGENAVIPRIVAAGALTPLKAYDVLLLALGQLANEGCDFELLLAGDGPERPRLERLASELQITQRVQFLGAIDNVPDVLASAHLLVHPSQSEGSSNTILEAMAEGLPVIATNVGGTPEIVTDYETGLLVPPNQPALLALRIRELVGSPLLRTWLGMAGLQVVRDRFSSARVVADYERLYESVVAQ
jgi:glycosyltransferase involved in cell wall biosynthesis